MEQEQEWARDLFDRARAGGDEPVWVPDHTAIGRAGDRRRRTRTLGAGGGVLGVLAVTTAVAVGFGGATAPGVAAVKQAPAGGGWGDRPLSDVFGDLTVTGGSVRDQKLDGFIGTHVPQSAAADLATLIGGLDPSLGHLRRVGEPVPQKIVADSAPEARNILRLMASSAWTTDGANPSRTGPVKARGALDIQFTADSAILVGHPVGPRACGYPVEMIEAGSGTGAATRQWSDCVKTTLADGSTVSTTTARVGEGSETVAVREFKDDQGGIVLVARDFPVGSGYGAPAEPAHDTVLKENPWSEKLLRTALSDPALTLPLTSDGVTAAPAGFLAPSDLGTGWTFDPSSVHGATTELSMDNGCTPDESEFGLDQGRLSGYDGTLPGGKAVQVLEGEYKLKKGTGAALMAKARQRAQGGCDPSPGVEFSKDTAVDLPSGIGDSAFVQYDHGDAQVRIVVRFGDTIVETFVTEAAAGTHGTIPDLSSPADQAWLTHTAEQIAARWTGK